MISLVALALGQEVPFEESIRYASIELEDGLRVFALHQDQGDRVTIVTRIAGGRSDEMDPGVALMTGSTWFEGAATPVASVQDVYDRIPADSTVSVDATHTEFTTIVPMDSLAVSLSLEWLRLSEPLKGVDSLASITHSASRDAFNAKYLAPVFEALFPEREDLQRLSAAPRDEHPVYVGNAWVARQWLPSNTTLVVASSMDPVDMLCTVHPTGCNATEKTVSDVLTTPEPVFGYARTKADSKRVGPTSAGVDPVLLAAWRLPFRGAAARFVRDHIEEQLQSKVRSRCHTFDATEETVLVCTFSADTDEDDLVRMFRKGWDTKKLPQEVPAFQQEVLFGLRGSSASTDMPTRFARRVSVGQTPSPYTGQRGDLAFDAGWMEQVLDDLEIRRASFIRLVP